MIWITGDKHGDFTEVEAFCREWQTQLSDVLIILGDAGINYFQDARALALKQHLAQLPITLFCVHGNHEARPETVAGYELQPGFGGQVYVDPRFPNQVFPVDGELYTLGRQRVLVIGGAYSVDKFYRLLNHWAWFEDEQPSAEIRARAEAAAARANWQVDAVLSHTCPLSQVPREKLPPLGSQVELDQSTEKWLETLREKLTFGHWFAGHYHIDYAVENFTFLFHQFLVFDV
ncbi:MAG: metallophosphoesterase [Lentisphaeraceae bacterium]|nr:metallophosphoesterase [Lentisphaeraceae bacterium]